MGSRAASTVAQCQRGAPHRWLDALITCATALAKHGNKVPYLLAAEASMSVPPTPPPLDRTSGNSNTSQLSASFSQFPATLPTSGKARARQQSLAFFVRCSTKRQLVNYQWISTGHYYGYGWLAPRINLPINHKPPLSPNQQQATPSQTTRAPLLILPVRLSGPDAIMMDMSGKRSFCSCAQPGTKHYQPRRVFGTLHCCGRARKQSINQSIIRPLRQLTS